MSNLIALQNTSNELGLGTSHIGLGTIGPSVLPFKNQDGTILMNFNTSNNTINLGTISSGVWQGSVIEKDYGGIGNIGIGPVNHILGLDSNLNYTWISNNVDITTATEISTYITSNLGIGSNQQELTINTSKLNINIDSITPQQDQVLKYSNDNGNVNLSWSNSNLGNIDNLWNLMKTVHPSYVLYLKSIQVLHTSIDTAGTLIPTFNPTTTNYSIDVTNNLTVSILSSLFSFPKRTPITTTQINNNSIKDSYVILSPSSNTYTIKNSYTENSQTYNKTYTLNITRNTLTNNNLQELVVNEEAFGNIINLNEILGVGTVYTIDIDEAIKNIKITSTINRTVQRLGIGTISSDIGTSLNISRNDDSIIGIGTGFIGIGTTLRNDGITNIDTNIDTGRISDVFLNIKAENDSSKLYSFKISHPPRNNANLDEIILKKIKSNNTSDFIDTFNNPSIGTIKSVNIETNYEEIKFEIKKKHLDQITTIQKITNQNGNITSYTTSTFNPSNTHSLTHNIPFSIYTLPLSNNIIDTFRIKNISSLGIGTQTYDVECSIERSSSTTLSTLIYKKNTQDSGILINTINQDISESPEIPTSVIIDVTRIGGQQVIFDVSNSTGINTNQHQDNLENFFSDPLHNNNNSEKTIHLNNTLSTFEIILKILAEDNVTEKTYNISISDSTAPTLNSITVVSNNTDPTKAIIGDTITLSFTASETLQANPTVIFSIGDTDNLSADTVTNVSGNDYTATYIVQSGQNGLVSFSISSYADNVGNNGSSVTTTTDSSSITVDNISGIFDSLTYAKNGLIGAYALRKLFVDYSGPTIRVNNSHDVYFNNLGQIILINPHETIANIINSRITKWYDQSKAFNDHDLVPGQYYDDNINSIGPQLIETARFSGYAVKFSKFTNNRITVKTPKSDSDTLWVNGGLAGFSGDQSHTIITSHFSTLNPTSNAYTGSPHTDNLFSIGRQGNFEGSGGSGHVFDQCIAYHPNFYYNSYYYNYGNQATISPPLKNSSNEIYFTLAFKYNNNPRNYKIFKSGTLKTSSNITTSSLNILKQHPKHLDNNHTRTNFELGNFSQRNSDNDYSIGSRFDGEVENFMLYNIAITNDSHIINISNLLL